MRLLPDLVRTGISGKFIWVVGNDHIDGLANLPLYDCKTGDLIANEEVMVTSVTLQRLVSSSGEKPGRVDPHSHPYETEYYFPLKGDAFLKYQSGGVNSLHGQLDHDVEVEGLEIDGWEMEEELPVLILRDQTTHLLYRIRAVPAVRGQVHALDNKEEQTLWISIKVIELDAASGVTPEAIRQNAGNEFIGTVFG